MARIEDTIQTEKQRRFTNRENELSLLEQLIYSTSSPLRIMGIYGVGGVGKSELLGEFVRHANNSQHPTLFIDGYSQKNILGILNRLRNLAGEYATPNFFYDFDRYFYLYVRMQNKVFRDDELIAEFKRAIERSHRIEENINVGGNFAQQESAISVLQDTFDPQDVKFYLRAELYLTEEFIRSLSKISPIKPWVLLIDAYENLVELDNWIRESLVRQLPDFFRVVIAGRKMFGREWHELRPVFKSINLLVFGEYHTKEYLRRRGIVEDELIDEVFKLTDGHPLFLAMLADAKEDNPALSAQDIFYDDKYLAIGSIARFIRESIKDNNLLDVIEIGSIVRFFDEDTLRYFLGEKSDERLNALNDYSFVYHRSEGFALHDSFWEFLNSELKQHNNQKFRELNQKAIFYYNDILESATRENWQKYIIEILYHKLAIDPQDGLLFLIDAYNAAEAQYRLDICEALIREAQVYNNETLNDWLLFLDARLAHNRDNWLNAQKKLEDLLRNKLLPEDLGSYALSWLGRVYYRVGELRKAEKIYIGSLKVYEEPNKKIQKAQILHQIGKIKIGQRKWSAAKTYLQRCLTTYSEIEDLNKLSSNLRDVDLKSISRNKAWALSSLGTVYLEQGFWNRALNIYTQSLEIFRTLSDDFGLARSLYRVGWGLQQIGKWEEAIESYKQSREILNKLGASYWVARVIVKLADTYRLIGDLNQSEAVYLECMRICIKLKAPLGIPVVLDCLGKLYQDKGLFRKAKKMHLRSLDKKRRNDFLFEIELTLLNLGDVEYKENNPKIALDYYDQSLQIMRKSKNRYGEALVLAKIGDALVLSGEVDKAEEYLVLADKIAKRQKYSDVMSIILMVRAKVFNKKGSYPDCAKNILKSLQEAGRFNQYYLLTISRGLRDSELLGSLPEGLPEISQIQKYFDKLRF